MARPDKYLLRDGTRVPGTTTVIGRFKDSSGLMYWAFKQGKSGAERLYEERDRAGEAGTLAHDWFEQHILGNPEPKPDPDNAIEISAYQAYENALEWLDGTRIQVIETETPLVSEEYRYGGTIDAIGRDAHDRLVLLDWKTSSGVYPDYLIQLAAYGHLLKECRGIEVERYHLVRFDKENGDFAHHGYQDLTDGWEQFKLFRAAYDIDRRLKKRV